MKMTAAAAIGALILAASAVPAVAGAIGMAASSSPGRQADRSEDHPRYSNPNCPLLLSARSPGRPRSRR